jgi:hypothetical protein
VQGGESIPFKFHSSLFGRREAILLEQTSDLGTREFSSELLLSRPYQVSKTSSDYCPPEHSATVIEQILEQHRARKSEQATILLATGSRYTNP